MRLIVLLLSRYSVSPEEARVPSSPVNEAHGMDAVQGQHNLSRVKASPFLWHIVIAHKVDQVTTRHVLHHHVEVAVVLECEKQLRDRRQKGKVRTSGSYKYLMCQTLCPLPSHLYHPGAVCEGHDVSLLPEESRVRPLDHFKLAQQLHCIYFAGGFVSNLQKGNDINSSFN